jgi:hypothetical protein
MNVRLCILLLLTTLPFCNSCRKVGTCQEEPTRFNNLIEKNVYFNVDSLICIRNGIDTILLYKTAITKSIYQMDLCDNNCVMSGGCHSLSEITVSSIPYSSKDHKYSISITRNFYSLHENIEYFYDNEYNYKIDNLTFALPDPSYDYNKELPELITDSIKLISGSYLKASKINTIRNANTQYGISYAPNYSFTIYSNDKKIVRYTNSQSGDTFDFIN